MKRFPRSVIDAKNGLFCESVSASGRKLGTFGVKKIRFYYYFFVTSFIRLRRASVEKGRLVMRKISSEKNSIRKASFGMEFGSSGGTGTRDKSERSSRSPTRRDNRKFEKKN